ncbi:MAG: nucleotidyltransferase domain-containing protein [Magnetococcus sp. YQC-9]
MDTAPLVTRLCDRLPNLLAIYAFGSRVTGGATPESDLDLAVLVEGRADPLVLWRTASELESLAGCVVDLVDLRAVPTTLQYRIITTGERLWTRDATRTGLFACYVLSAKTELDEVRAPLLERIAQEGRIHAG